MKNKLLELQELMAQEGFEESVGVASRCVEILKRKQQKENEEIEIPQGTNINANASHNRKTAPRNKTGASSMARHTKSVETIYESAVPKRNSSSSEEEFLLNSSDEIISNDRLNENKGNKQGKRETPDSEVNKRIEHLIAGVRLRQSQTGENEEERMRTPRARRSVSPSPQPDREITPPPEQEANSPLQEGQLSADERVRTMIQQVEAAKACMFAATGNNQPLNVTNSNS